MADKVSHIALPRLPLVPLHGPDCEISADPTPLPEIADRILIARLSLDAEGNVMSDDSDQLAVLASLPKGQTSYDYLVGAWKRCRAQESKTRKVNLPSEWGMVLLY